MVIQGKCKYIKAMEAVVCSCSFLGECYQKKKIKRVNFISFMMVLILFASYDYVSYLFNMHASFFMQSLDIIPAVSELYSYNAFNKIEELSIVLTAAVLPLTGFMYIFFRYLAELYDV